MLVLGPSCSRYPVISLQSAELTAAKSDAKSVAYEFHTVTGANFRAPLPLHVIMTGRDG